MLPYNITNIGKWNKTGTTMGIRTNIEHLIIAYFLGINGDCLIFNHLSKESDIYTTAMNCPIPAIFGTKHEQNKSSFFSY